MKTRLIILAAICVVLASTARAGTRDLFLPVWNIDEPVQPYSLVITGLHVPVIQMEMPCYVSVSNTTQGLISVTNGTARVELLIDLKKTKDPFSIAVLGPDPRGVMSNHLIHYVCHMSLLKRKFLCEVKGDGFAIINLTAQPFTVENSVGVTFKEREARRLSGTFSNGARIWLRGLPEINLKQN